MTDRDTQTDGETEADRHVARENRARQRRRIDGDGQIERRDG